MTSEEVLQAQVRYLEAQLLEAKWTYLDSMAQAALSSGRYAASQCYDIARNMLETRQCTTPSQT